MISAIKEKKRSLQNWWDKRVESGRSLQADDKCAESERWKHSSAQEPEKSMRGREERGGKTVSTSRTRGGGCASGDGTRLKGTQWAWSSQQDPDLERPYMLQEDGWRLFSEKSLRCFNILNVKMVICPCDGICIFKDISGCCVRRGTWEA